MKKLILSVITSTLLLFSCNKSLDDKEQQITQNSLMRSNEDPTIATFEEEAFDFSEEWSLKFGYTGIKIKAGKYFIKKDLSTNKFYCVLDIEELGTSTSEEPIIVTEGVRIVKRNLCSHHHKSCCCPLGFRCGFVPVEPTTAGNSEELAAKSYVDANTKEIVITFTEVTDPKTFEEKE